VTGRPGLPTRFPRPLTGGQLRAVPLRALARPAPIGRGVRVDPDLVIHHPGRALAGRWPDAGVTLCERCSAPVRSAVVDVIGALLGDTPALAQLECLWCGPRGVARAHPPLVLPVEVCIDPPVRRFP